MKLSYRPLRKNSGDFPLLSNADFYISNCKIRRQNENPSDDPQIRN
jgi:hypothetical protein